MLKKTIHNIIYVVTFLLTIGWVISETEWYSKVEYFSVAKWYPKKGWEPFVFLLTLISGATVWQSAQSAQRDVTLAKEFLLDFPSDGYSAPFLEEHNMGNSFHLDKLKEIKNIVDNWDNAEHEFQDQKLEVLRKKFYQQCRDFLNDLTQNTYPLDVDPKVFKMHLGDGFHKDPKAMLKMGALNQNARKLYELHQNLIRAFFILS